MSGQTEEAQPGYAEIKAASALHPDSGAWAFFMREIIRLPREMTPVVFQVIRLKMWKLAPDPLEAIRSEAIETHGRAWAKPTIGPSTRASPSDKSR
jgi:hypothetical protein